MHTPSSQISRRLLAAACAGAMLLPAPAVATPAAAVATRQIAVPPAARTVALALPAGASATSPTAPARRSVTFSVSDASVRKGERIWFAGKVTATSAGGRTVKLERRRPGGTWKSSSTTTTRSNGRFSGSVRPTGVFEYRVRVASGGSAALTSPARTVRLSSGPRPLAQRAEMIGPSRLGAPRHAVRELTARQRKASKAKGASEIRYQRHAKGMLVSVTFGGSARTWLVSGKILKTYLSAGGPTGKLGVPVADARCGLLENGCVQRFTRGTVYSSSWAAKAAATSTTGSRGEVIAAARSQVGFRYRYRTPRAQQTKYNKWMGTSRAWCSFFVSWSSAASGNGGTIPKSTSFARFKKKVNATMRTGSTPRVGALVFFNTVPPAGTATHVGLVTDVTATTITVVDGNTVGPLPPGHRGVLERTWPRSRALYYAYPKY